MAAWGIIFTTVLLLKTSLTVTQPSTPRENGSDGDTPQYDQAKEAFLLLDVLASHYLPNCLRVLFLSPNSSNNTPNSSNNMEFKSEDINSNGRALILQMFQHSNMHNENTLICELAQQANVIINDDNINTTKETIEYINKYPGKVTRTACVSYMLPGPLDSRLLPVLTDPTSSKKLTRYFLIHTQNSTEAEQFLLDQRLGKEENVAALVQEESQNKSYWRVLIRQLLHPSGSPQVLTVNRWSRDTGLTSTENIFPEQMANFYGEKLSAVTLHYKPFIAYDKVKGSLVVNPKPSLDINLLNLIANKLNFTYDIVMPADGFWGVRNDDGHFQGVVGEVEDGRANLSLVLSITQERAEVVDFTRLYFMDPMTFLTAKSDPSPPWRKIITPFQGTVWLCVLVSVGGGSLLYHVIYHTQATLGSSSLLSSSAFMHVLASFLSQSLSYFPQLSTGKVFLGSWFLYVLLLTTYYKTSLTSTLAVPFAPPTLNTLVQLYNSDFDYGLNSAKSSTYQFLSTSNTSLYRSLLSNMHYHSNAENFRRVARGNYAFISFKSFLSLHMVTHNSDPKRETDLHLANEEFIPGGYAWAFPKDAPYRRTFDAVMLRGIQAGLIEYWFQDLTAYYVRRSRVQKMEMGEDDEGQERKTNQDNKQVVFTLDHLQGPFFILCLGYGGGALLMVLEVVAFRVFKSSGTEL